MFWENISTYVGPSTFRVEFMDGLANQGDNGFVIAPLNVYRRSDGQAPAYYLTDSNVYGWPWETARVYFLPWRNGRATRVTIAALNATGCDYFTTSEFSGCRFVATDQEVMHVAWSGGGGHWGTANGARGTSVLRTMAEREAMGDGGVRQFRRAVSISNLNRVGAGPAVGDGVTRTSYRANPMVQSRMKVFGYKVNGEWTFTTLKYVGFGNSHQGVWETLE